MAHAPHHTQTLDRDEVVRFARLSGEWWDEHGSFRQLHRINPVRLAYIRDQLCQRFGRDAKEAANLSSLSVLDIGCGGGLVCEPLARLGARVTGIDPAAENIVAAKAHASAAGLNIAYEVATAEELAPRRRRYDVVLLLEVVEHVPDVPAFIKTVAPLVKPGGMMILSTLNRTLKAYALGIVGAELILRWLPAGTHQWQRFVKPEELASALTAEGLTLASTEGLIYDPFSDEWRLGSDTGVNYFVAAMRRT